LIINELVMNVLAHAFEKETDDPRIRIGIEGGDEYQLFVEDNGRGLPESFSIEQTDTLGMEMLRSMARQLDGRLSADDTEHTRFTVHFPSQKTPSTD